MSTSLQIVIRLSGMKHDSTKDNKSLKIKTDDLQDELKKESDGIVGMNDDSERFYSHYLLQSK